MLGNIFPPFTTMQECNLDWILTKVKNILRFVPDDGQVGQILRRTRSGAEWSDEQGGGGAVNSVNGQTGTVVLTAADVGALPDTYVAPVTSVNGQTGDVIVSGGAVDSVNGQTGTVVLGKSDIGLGNVDNVQQYSATNPPPYPVTSVNSQTGAVSLSIPTDTGDLTNNAGFVDAAGAAAAAPVQSVNSKTGTVVLNASDVGAVSTGYTTATATRVGTYIFSMNLAKAGEVKVASYEIRTASALIPAAYTLVATLPSGYEPSIQTYQVFVDGDGKRAIIRLDTDGNVYMYNYSGSHMSSAWSITYI